MTFLGRLDVCVYNRKCSQHGERVCLAPLRSRWARLVGRTGGQALLWFHRDHRGHMQGQLTTPHCLRSESASSQQAKFFLPREYVTSYSQCAVSPVCDHCVTMETGLLSRIYTHLSHCSVVQPAVMTWVFYKLLSSVAKHLFTCTRRGIQLLRSSVICKAARNASASWLLLLSIQKHTAVTQT